MHNSYYISIHTLIAVFVSVFYGVLYVGALAVGKNISLYLVSVLGLILLLYIMISWKRTYYRIFCPYIIIVTTLFLTLCGQALVWALGLTAGYRDLRYAAYRTVRFSNDSLCMALLFAYLCICVMHVVVINSISTTTRKTKSKRLADGKNRRHLNPEYNVMDRNLYHIIIFVGLGFILMTFPFYIISSLSQYASIRSAGYGAQYENVTYGLSSIGVKIGEFFPVGIITVLYAWGKGNAYNIKNYGLKASFTYLMTAVYLLMELLLSQRTAVILFAIAMLFVFFSNKLFPKRLIVAGLVASLILMAAMRMIDLMRREAIHSVSEFFTYALDAQNSPVLDFLGDIGWNLMTTVKFQEVIPEVRGYGFGSSYLISLTSIIPNLNFWSVHPAYQYGNISAWLQEYLGFSFGIGCTPVAEAYFNFGSLGFLIFIVWGKVAVALNRKFDEPQSVLDHYQVVLFMGLILKSFVRSSFFAVFRPVIFYIWIPTVIIKTIYAILSKR